MTPLECISNPMTEDPMDTITAPTPTTPEVEPFDVPVLDREPQVDRVLAILRGGRDAVRRRWAFRKWSTSNGAVCAVRGILNAEGEESAKMPATREGEEAILLLGRALAGINFRVPERARKRIIDINDGHVYGYRRVITASERRRIKADVLRAYDEAIEARKDHV